jgi:hypothetical protein
MGSDAYLLVDETDISDYVESSDLGFTRATDDINTYGLDWASRLAGVISAALNAACAYDETLDAVIWAALISADPVAFEFGPHGNVVGKILYSGNMYINATQISAPSGAAVRQTFSCMITGEVSHDAITE